MHPEIPNLHFNGMCVGMLPWIVDPSSLSAALLPPERIRAPLRLTNLKLQVNCCGVSHQRQTWHGLGCSTMVDADAEDTMPSDSDELDKPSEQKTQLTVRKLKSDCQITNKEVKKMETLTEGISEGVACECTTNLNSERAARHREYRPEAKIVQTDFTFLEQRLR